MGMTRRTGNNPHHEPSAGGDANVKRSVPLYIGCRTRAYGPVEMTFWSRNTLMFAPLEQLRIVQAEIDADRVGAQHENRDQRPGLPIVERARGEKQQQPEGGNPHT